MRYAVVAIFVVLFLAAAILARGTMPPMPPEREYPIATITKKPLPQIGLAVPLPNWIPLPESGFVTGVELFPPHLPYGGGAVIVLRYAETQGQFVVDYRHRLERAGFVMRRFPFVFHLINDWPDAVYEADEKNGGHVAYITLRSGFGKRYAQLTFYAPPAPRLHL